MNEQRRRAVKQLSIVLEQENHLLQTQRYGQVRLLLADKQKALAALEHSPADQSADPDTDSDAALARTLAGLAEENRTALQRALRVQNRIMGIVSHAVRRMAETPLYGDKGIRATRKTSLAVAIVTQA